MVCQKYQKTEDCVKILIDNQRSAAQIRLLATDSQVDPWTMVQIYHFFLFITFPMNRWNYSGQFIIWFRLKSQFFIIIQMGQETVMMGQDGPGTRVQLMSVKLGQDKKSLDLILPRPQFSSKTYSLQTISQQTLSQHPLSQQTLSADTLSADTSQ